MEINDIQLAKAFRILDRLKPGEIITIADYANGKDELFVECAKKYIDSQKQGEFNKDYTKFKKLPEWQTIKQ